MRAPENSEKPYGMTHHTGSPTVMGRAILNRSPGLDWSGWQWGPLDCSLWLLCSDPTVKSLLRMSDYWVGSTSTVYTGSPVFC